MMQFSFGYFVRALVFGTVLASFGAGGSVAQSTSAPQSGYSEEWSPYVTAEDLNALITRDPEVQIIDIRSEKYVKTGTIPGSVWLPFKQWRGPKERPGKPPLEEELEVMLGAQGLDLSRPIVVLNHSGNTIQAGRAAIVYWILKSSGAEKIAILNGGFKAWQDKEFPQAAGHKTPEPTIVEVNYRREWWADPVEIFGVASGQTDGAILDARLDAQVKKSMKTGKPMQSMPMARFIPASFFMNPLSDENRSETGLSTFRADLEARGIKLDAGFLISVCQTGELSALSWFYASEIAGLKNVLYYPDALQGWKSDGGLMFGLKPS